MTIPWRTHIQWQIWAWIGTCVLALTTSILVLSANVYRKLHQSVLQTIYPQSTRQSLTARHQPAPEEFQVATVCCLEIVEYYTRGPPSTKLVLEVLQRFQFELDALARQFELHVLVPASVEQYLAFAPGLDGAERVARFGLAALDLAESYRDHIQVSVRGGLSSGPLVAGAVGRGYRVMGECAFEARRLSYSSLKDRLQICNGTQELLRQAPHFEFELLQINARQTWWLHDCGARIKTNEQHDFHVEQAKTLRS